MWSTNAKGLLIQKKFLTVWFPPDLLYLLGNWTSKWDRLSQSRSHGFLVWCGRTRHELLLTRSLVLRARRSYNHASRSLSRYTLKRSTCEQVYKVRFPYFLSYNTSTATYVCCHFWCSYPWNKWWRLVLSVYIGQLKFKCCIQGAKFLLPSFFLCQ